MKTYLIIPILVMQLSGLSQDSIRQIKIAKDQLYLNLPVAETSRICRMKIKLNGEVLDQFTIKLANAKPDYWVFFDVSRYQGKVLTLELSNSVQPNKGFGNAQPGITPASESSEENNSKGFHLINADKGFPGEDSLYKEVLRPQVHFTSRRGWLNDPNGLIYYNNEYHLFYQHNPYGWAWGNMHWGHAVSKDIIHWEELPDAIYPMRERDAAFSGSAIIDKQNTADFRKNGIDTLIAVYTSTGRGECLKISYDNGRTFSEYEGNPVVVHRGRDPKVFWYAPGGNWVMVVWDNSKTRKIGLEDSATVNEHAIYTSPDLKNWTYQSGIGGFFECAELFESVVEGTGISKWVMYDASGRYVVGDFNGKKFSIDQQLKRYDYGGGYFYASQTYNNAPDNRRIQIGWGRGISNPGMPFNQPMLFPTELTLKNTFDGLRLCPRPISEISSLYKTTQLTENKLIKGDTRISVPVKESALHIVAEFQKGDGEFGLNVLGYEITYNDLMGEFITNYNNKAITHNYVKLGSDKLKFEVIVDKNIIEVFLNDGEIYYVTPFDNKQTQTVEAFLKGRGVNRRVFLNKFVVHELNSIWQK